MSSQIKDSSTKDVILRSLHDLPGARENIQKILDISSGGVLSKTVSFCDIVEGLQSCLIHENAAERSLGTKFLADVLNALPHDFANELELGFLVSFFVNRMKDHHSVIPHVIVGYMALVKQDNISAEDVSSIILSIFRDVHCQSQVMTDRRNVYHVLRKCLLDRKEVILKINSEFLVGFITAMDGEKDPRNLMLLFSLIPHLAACLSLNTFAEELFEVVAAYFPIDFIPPANDPFGIVPDDLIYGLRNCLASTDAFAPYCIPLLLEKLDSDVTSAKLDALLTLQKCFRNYSAESVSPHSILLWNSLRREVVEGWKEELEKESLCCLTELVSNLEKGSTTHALRDCINHLGSLAMMECLGNLSNPEQRLMFPSANILLALIESSPTLTILIQKQVLPLLVNMIKSKRETSPLKTTLTLLAKFLSQGARSGLLTQEPLSSYQESCFTAIYQELLSEDKIVQLSSVCALRTAAIALTETQKYLATEKMTKILMTTQDIKLRDSVIECLKGFDQLHSLILSEILTEIQLDFNENESERLKFLLETISTLSTTSSGLKTVWPIVWQQMLVLLDCGHLNCIYYLLCLKKLVMNSLTNKLDSSFITSEFKSVRKLTSVCVRCIASSSFIDPIPVLQEMSNLCQELVRSENEMEIQTLVICILGIDSRHIEEIDDQTMQNLIVQQGEKSSLMIFPFEGLLLSFKSFCQFDYLQEVILRVQHWSLHAKDSRIRESSAILLSVILNKLTDSSLSSYLEQLAPYIFSLRESSAVRLLGWIIKGLILQGHKDDSIWIKKLEALLLDDQLCSDASECYEFILKDISVFSNANGAKIRMLYKQRFFESRISSLVHQFQSHQGQAKFSTLLAISYLLPNVSQIILKGHMQKLLPVLTQGLNCEDLTVTKGAVTTLAALLTHSIEDIKPYLSTLLAPLLQLTSSSHIVVRLKSLECLESLAQLPTPSVVPYRDDVIKGLKPALNDRKRIVRQAASNASCAWVLI